MVEHAKALVSNGQTPISAAELFENLVGNCQAAMMAAIEIYNKPVFQYRDECTVILLLNAWELLLKAILAKHGETIYYPQKLNQPAKTLSWKDAFPRAQVYFPSTVASLPTERNLDLLGSYRDKAIHFYNEKDMALVTYSLSQTSIVNFRDVLYGLFDIDIASQMNWHLLPLGTRPPIDVISFIQGRAQIDKASVTSQYLAELSQATEELRSANEDTGRLLTVFNIKLESIKKIGDADAVVAVDNDSTQDHPLTVVRRQDPNQSHPLRQKDIVSQISELHGSRFSPHTFQAIVWKYQIKENPQYCWVAKENILTRYSNDMMAFIRQLTESEIKESSLDYRDHIRSRRKTTP